MSEEAICVWIMDEEGNYETGCQEMFTIESGTATENGFNYCPYCGCELIEVQYTDIQKLKGKRL